MQLVSIISFQKFVYSIAIYATLKMWHFYAIHYKMRTSKEQITQSKNLLEKEYIEKIKMPKYKEKYIYWFENIYGDNSLERCEEFLNQY